MAKFKVDQQSYEITEINENRAELVLAESDLKKNALNDVKCLKKPKDFFVYQSASFSDEHLRFEYDVTDLNSFDIIQNSNRVERLKIAERMLVVKELVDTPFTTVLHPDNLRFTQSGELRILYRGLIGQLPPMIFNKEVLLNQLKSVMLVLLNGNEDFISYYEGNAEIVQGKFSKEINNAKDFDELQDAITNELKVIQKYESANNISIPKIKYRIVQQLAIWMSILAVSASVMVGYWQFSVKPYENQLSSANTYYLKSDYEGVQKTLESINYHNLPSTQRFELAHSYVQTASLSSKQRKNILNNISINANINYLNYWIENGRGNLNEALDIAKKTEDIDLILYALNQKISATKTDNNLSGSEREKEIESLEKQSDSYNKERKKILKADKKDEK